MLVNCTAVGAAIFLIIGKGKIMKISKNQKGFSLVEVLVVFTIAAFVLAAIYRIATAADEGKVTKVVNDDFRLLDRLIVQSRGPSAYSLNGITVGEVVATDKSGKLARDTDGSGSIDASDSMFVGGNYEVMDLDSATIISTDDAYAVVLGGFSDQNCVGIAQSLWGIVDQIEIADASASPSAAIGTSIKTGINAPMDSTASTAITTGCSNSDNNAIIVAKRISG